MGRKPKYATEEARREAKREAQRRYNEKHHEKRLEGWHKQNEKRKRLQELGKKYEAILQGSEKDPQKQ